MINGSYRTGKVEEELFHYCSIDGSIIIYNCEKVYVTKLVNLVLMKSTYVRSISNYPYANGQMLSYCEFFSHNHHQLLWYYRSPPCLNNGGRQPNGSIYDIKNRTIYFTKFTSYTYNGAKKPHIFKLSFIWKKEWCPFIHNNLGKLKLRVRIFC